MVQQTLTRLYDHYSDAEAIVRELEAAGIPHSDISLVANSESHERSMNSLTKPTTTTDATFANGSATGAATGAVAGTVLGGGAGLLAGIGALAIPGVGPVVAAGWLVATLAGAGIGAASGSLVGSLTGAGVSHDEAHAYAEGVRRGGSLVTVRVDQTHVPQAEMIMAQRPSVDWQQQRDAYNQEAKVADEPLRYPRRDEETTYATANDPAQRL